MGTFKDSLKKWFYTQGTAAATTSARIPLLDASGNPIGSDTPQNLFKLQPLFTGNVGVASIESDAWRFRQGDQAASYISTAVGVWICEHGKLIVVAKDQQASTKWANSNVTGGTTVLRGEAAVADMDGRTKTATILNTLGENAPAATYCNNYYPSNVDSASSVAGAGRWWLPSSGELWMIWSHLLEVNRILQIIGGTELSRSQRYWSSTEGSAAGAWYLTFSDGGFSYRNKSYEYFVRPVSAFY